MIVVKVGGGDGLDHEALADDLAALHREGERLLVVHGGNAEMDRISVALGHPPRFVTSPSGHVSRYTDRATLEIFQMVYRGKLNQALVERLVRRGVRAVGLSGLDGRLLEGRRKSTVRSVEDGKTKLLRGDHTGTVDRVHRPLLDLLLASGYLPVITPPAAAEDGTPINVDGDRAAAALAAALEADTLLLLSDVPGLLRDPSDPTSLIHEADGERLDGVLRYAQGRMRKKLLGAGEALRGGVARVVLADGRVARPVRRALAGRGTVIERRSDVMPLNSEEPA